MRPLTALLLPVVLAGVPTAAEAQKLLTLTDPRSVTAQPDLSGRRTVYDAIKAAVPPTNAPTGVFRKPVYRLAVALVEFAEVRHDARVMARDWERALFSRGTYTDRDPTGQQVFGSLNDYYREQSCGRFRIEGKGFDPFRVRHPRPEYAADRTALLTEALDGLLARDGEGAFKDFDGLFFVTGGDRVAAAPGGMDWPHRATLSHQGRRWDYMLCPGGSGRMASISVIAHEFGHLLGLPDLYVSPESSGQEGAGVWCTMAVGHGRTGKPLHLSAWCKERLDWLKPAIVDPRVRQRLILSPVENSPTECLKVLLKPDGSEYLLLENRKATGFDRDLPDEGLVIWRVGNGRPVLEETPAGRQHTRAPSPITNVERLRDGRVLFDLGMK